MVFCLFSIIFFSSSSRGGTFLLLPSVRQETEKKNYQHFSLCMFVVEFNFSGDVSLVAARGGGKGGTRKFREFKTSLLSYF